MRLIHFIYLLFCWVIGRFRFMAFQILTAVKMTWKLSPTPTLHVYSYIFASTFFAAFVCMTSKVSKKPVENQYRMQNSVYMFDGLVYKVFNLICCEKEVVERKLCLWDCCQVCSTSTKSFVRIFDLIQRPMHIPMYVGALSLVQALVLFHAIELYILKPNQPDGFENGKHCYKLTTCSKFGMFSVLNIALAPCEMLFRLVIEPNSHKRPKRTFKNQKPNVLGIEISMWMQNHFQFKKFNYSRNFTDKTTLANGKMECWYRSNNRTNKSAINRKMWCTISLPLSLCVCVWMNVIYVPA